MTIKLDLAQGATAPLAERLDRQDAQARQDRWMLELERAALSSSAKKLRGAPRDGAVAAPGAPARPTDAEPASPTTGTRAAGASEAAGAPTGAGAARPGTHVQSAAPPSTAMRVAAANASAPGAPAAVVPATASAPATAAPARAAAAADGAVDATERRQASAPLTAFGHARLPDHATQARVELAERPVSGTDLPVDGAPFDKRLMHLFAGPDGTHAYIRDAELGAAQARGVAMALGAALADSGQALTQLTVNGKRISLANNHVPGAVPAGAPSHMQPLALVRKELSK